jgi:hypothetical protein
MLGLIAVVAAAAAGHAPGRGESAPTASAPTLLKDYAATLSLLVIPIGVALIFWSALLRRMDIPMMKPNPYAGHFSIKPVYVLVGIAVVLFIAVRYSDPNRPLGKPPPAAGAKSGTKSDRQQKGYEPQFRWLPILVIGSLIGGIGGTMGLLALRRRQAELASIPIQVTLAEVLSETLDDLRREADPRRAVIRAYARMERTLAARGLPRHEFEAPVEYLTRVLEAVEASSHSVQRLTKLFQRARFSTHEIDAGMKEDAIDALSGLRAELETAR